MNGLKHERIGYYDSCTLIFVQLRNDRKVLFVSAKIILLGNILCYNPSNIFARARLIKTRHVTQYAPNKIGEYPSDIPQFK